MLQLPFQGFRKTEVMAFNKIVDKRSQNTTYTKRDMDEFIHNGFYIILDIILYFVSLLHIYYSISKHNLKKKKNKETILVPHNLDQKISEQIQPPNIHLKYCVHLTEIITHDK